MMKILHREVLAEVQNTRVIVLYVIAQNATQAIMERLRQKE